MRAPAPHNRPYSGHDVARHQNDPIGWVGGQLQRYYRGTHAGVARPPTLWVQGHRSLSLTGFAGAKPVVHAGD